MDVIERYRHQASGGVLPDVKEHWDVAGERERNEARAAGQRQGEAERGGNPEPLADGPLGIAYCTGELPAMIASGS